MLKNLIAASLLTLACLSPLRADPPPLNTIERLDVARYMGTWYQIAHYPNRFQAKCVGETSATYSLTPSGTVSVLNRCRLADGRMNEALGEARQLGGPDSPRLQVRFAPAWLGFLPFVWGNYWIIDLDPAYDLVAISEPQRDYLWILARQPEVDPARLAALKQRLAGMGFEVGRLE